MALRRNSPYFLLFWLCSALFSAPAQGQITFKKSTTRAVVVGISAYQNISKLKFAHKDAEAFVEFLRAPAGGNVPEDHIKLLTNEKATEAQIGSALYWLFTESEEGDLAIIYFSGHGDVETKFTKNGYLLAVDVNKSTYMIGGAISIRDLQDIITNLTTDKNVQVLLITDACHSGNLAGSESGGALTTSMALANPFGKDVKIMSCKADEVSLEDERWGGGHSVFSYYLLEGLRGLADVNEDRKVSLLEIERFLQDSVRHATAVLERRQTPVTYGNEDQVVSKVDAATLAALKQKYKPQTTESTQPNGKASPSVALNSDSAVLRLYHDFEEALRRGHLLEPDSGSAYQIYQLIKDQPSMRSYKNGMRSDLAASLQDEAQKAIKEYLVADPREMRRRWDLNLSRYQRYPKYLETAAELLGSGHFNYHQIKARQYYFSGLSVRLQGERSKSRPEKDSLYALAKTFQEKTLAIDSMAPYAYNELGLLSRRFRQYAQSVEYFNRAARFSPTWVLPWANLCGSYNELGQTEQAASSGLKALELDSTMALTHYNLGYVYLTKHDNSKSTYHFQKTIFYQPDYIDAYYNLALSYYNDKKYLEAEAMWKEYDKRSPNDPATLTSLGQVGLDLNKGLDYALPFLLKAIEIDSNYANAYLDLGTAYLDINQQQKASTYLNRCIQLAPESPEGHFQMARLQNQNSAAALKSLEIAFQNGFKDYDRLNTDSRLHALRKKAEFKSLLKEYFPEKG